MSHKPPLALLALVFVMLPGCKQPAGLPQNDAHAATVRTTYCYVVDDQSKRGHVDWYEDGRTPPAGTYSRSSPTIIRGYYQNGSGWAWPRQNGFCTFEVPYFTSPGMVPVCTLFYYQSAHSGSADLRVNYLYDITWNPTDQALFWAAWGDTLIVATDGAQDNGWHAVALSGAGCEVVEDIAASTPSGGNLITGWTYRGYTTGTYADVTGSGANAPYIKVVYDAPYRTD